MAPHFEIVLDHDAHAMAAWTFAGEKGKRSYCLRADVAWDVRHWINAKTEASWPLDALRVQVEEESFLTNLQSPVHFVEKDFVPGAASQNVRYRRVADPSKVTTVEDTVSLVVALGTA